MSEHAFVTGATGLIGRWLVPELTRRAVPVTAMIRDAASRAGQYRDWVASQGGDPALVTVVEGDLTREGLGLDAPARALADRATVWFHLGAAMAMGLDPTVAAQTNEAGSRRVMELAARAPGLRRLVVVSGYRVASATPRGTGRLGAYEQSKVDADRLIRTLAKQHSIALTVVNPSTVIGDSRSGRTTVFWGFGDLVRDVYQRRLPAVPGGPGHWLPLVTVDYLARFLATVPLADDAALAEYFVLDDGTPDIARLVQRIAYRLGVPAPARRAPLGLVRAVSALRGRGEQAEALSFLSTDRYDTGPAQTAARRAGIMAPDIEQAIDRSVDYLVATRFGAEPEAAGGYTPVAGVTTFVAGDRERARVVLFHGYPLDGSSWDPVVRRLGEIPSLRPDLAGPSRSWQAPPDDGAWAVSLTGEVAGPAVLAGHSFGISAAFQVALRHPERVGSLVLVSPYFLQAPAPYHLRAAPLNRAVLRLMGRKDLRAIVGDDRYADLLHQNITGRAGARARLARGLTRAHRQRALLETQLHRLAATVPITIVHGADEPLTRPVPAGVRVIIAGRGHNPHIEEPTRLAELLTEQVMATQEALPSLGLAT